MPDPDADLPQTPPAWGTSVAWHQVAAPRKFINVNAGPTRWPVRPIYGQHYVKVQRPLHIPHSRLHMDRDSGWGRGLDPRQAKLFPAVRVRIRIRFGIRVRVRPLIYIRIVAGIRL